MGQRIRWTPQAAGDFERIVNFAREHSSPEKALEVAERLYKDINSIPEWPRRGRKLRLPQGSRQRIFLKYYRVIYRLEADDVVMLLRVFHTLEDPKFSY